MLARIVVEVITRLEMLKAIFHGGWAFMRTYVIQAGFLDGREGFMLSVSNAEGTYYRYVKLWLMQRDGPADPARP